MHLIEGSPEQLTELRRHLNPGPIFQALIQVQSRRGARLARGADTSGAPGNTVAREVNATIASSREEFRAAGALVMRRYAWRGYVIDARALNHPAPGEPAGSEITLIANDADGKTVGTLTLGLDGPEGLGADEVYGCELDAVRSAGRRVCELTRLAVHEQADSGSVLAALFGLAFLLGRILHRATDVFIEVNPRHVAFYERALGFVVEAGERICERVKAPSVLLRLEADKLETRLRRLGFGNFDDCVVSV